MENQFKRNFTFLPGKMVRIIIVAKLLLLMVLLPAINVSAADPQITGPEVYSVQNAVSGKVTDSNGEPLPGVTVAVKGTNLGSLTDIDGRFSISNIPNGAVLVFSFVGLKAQEIPVSGQTSIDVQMEEEAIGLAEVVVIGYGTVARRSTITRGGLLGQASPAAEENARKRSRVLLALRPLYML